MLLLGSSRRATLHKACTNMAPQTPDMKEERVLYGDSKGGSIMLLCGCRELPARDLICTGTEAKARGRHSDLHQEIKTACC